MEFTEFGNENGKKFLLLPGTACKWQFNFEDVIDKLAEKYHIIAVNYDGFENDKTKIFTDMLTVTNKIENYILENHGGKVDGAYGSSLGGSFVGLLVQRKHIHIDHAFIGSSDLDQGGKIVARMLTILVGLMFSGACKSEVKREKMKAKLQRRANAENKNQSMKFTENFIDNLANLNPKTITRQFYSDYITPLEENIAVNGTTIHVIYALKMGEKYAKRYHKYFLNPDIHEFDMEHEAWLFDEIGQKSVLACIDTCMDEN